MFKLTTELRVAIGRTEAQIFLTEDGEYLLKENGPWFVKRLTMERELDSVNAKAEELQQKKAGIKEQIAAEKLRLKERRERRV